MQELYIPDTVIPHRLREVSAQPSFISEMEKIHKRPSPSTKNRIFTSEIETSHKRPLASERIEINLKCPPNKRSLTSERIESKLNNPPPQGKATVYMFCEQKGFGFLHVDDYTKRIFFRKENVNRLDIKNGDKCLYTINSQDPSQTKAKSVMFFIWETKEMSRNSDSHNMKSSHSEDFASALQKHIEKIEA